MWWAFCDGLEGVGFYVFCSVPSVCTNGLLSGWILGFGNFVFLLGRARAVCVADVVWNVAFGIAVLDVR